MATPTTKKQWGHVVGIALVGLVVLACVAHWIWGQIELSRFQATLAKMKSAGEPLNFSQLTADPTPDSDDASLTYLRASKAIQSQSLARQRFDQCQDPDGYKTPLLALEQADISGIVDENRASLDLCTAARAQRPGDWHDAWTSPYLMASLNLDFKSARPLANLLRLDAERLHEQHRDTECLQMHDIVRLSNAGQKRVGLVAHCVAAGIRALVCEAVDRLAPQLDSSVDRGEVNALVRALLDETHEGAGRHLSFRSERIMECELYVQFMNGHLNPTDDLPTGKIIQMPTALYVVRPFLVADATGAVKALEQIERACDAPDLPDAMAGMPIAFDANEMHIRCST